MKTKIPNNEEYQRRELLAFLRSEHGYHDTAKEFAASLESMNISEQIQWIENGSYGCGPCLALQKTLRDLTPRMNARAHVGQIILHAFHGKPFRCYSKLPASVRAKLDSAVDDFLTREKDFAIQLAI